jgi:hypothetical protein
VPIFLREGRAVLFAHVPKTGGTSIERLFRRAGWETHFRATRRSDPTLFPVLRCSPQHYHATILQELVAVERLDVAFLVTRHPLDRFRSEYVMRNIGDPRTDATSVERWAFQAFGAYRANPFVYDNHLRPQWEFELPGARIYRLEEGLGAVVADLNERYGLGLDTAIPHSSHSKKRSGPPSSSVEISPAVAELVADLYEEDFTRFGYSLPEA